MKFAYLSILLFLISFSSYSQNKENQNRLDSISTTLENLSWKELDSLGDQAREALNYKEAEIYFKKNIEIAKSDSLLATSLQKLGNLYHLARRFNEALTVFSETKEVQEKLGKQRVDYASACRNLAVIYKELGNLEEAEKLQLEAKDIIEKTVGKNNNEYAKSCNELAIIYNDKGKPIKAEEYYLEALAIRENFKDKLPLEYAVSCGNLAIVYIYQGLYDKAEPLCIIAKETCKKEVGEKHPYYSAFSGNLAYLYLQQQKYDKAKEIMLEIIKIKKETVGKNHLDYLNSYRNLGYYYKAEGDFKEAEVIFAELREKYEKLLGKDHLLYAISCNDLGTAHYWQGEYEKAEQFYLENRKIIEKILGKQNKDYTRTQSNLAILYRDAELYTKAKPYFEEVTNRVNADVILYFPTLSEKERFSYMQNVEHFFDKLTQFVIKSYPANKINSEMLFNQQLFSKGIVFSSTQKMKEQILNSKDSVLINQYEDWKTEKENYISLLQLPLNERDSSINTEKIASQINELEKEISKKSKLFESNTTQKEYKWQDVQKTLSEKEVAIEIVRFNKKNQYNEEFDTTYIAMIVTKETIESPELILLENGHELENGALSFYQNNIEFQLEDTESYNQYWKPIQDKLDSLSNKKGYSKIYFSPDGIYHKINLNTLQNPKTGKYLVEQETIQLITSSRDLIERAEKGITSIDLSKNFEKYQTFLLGYPSYNLNGKDTLKVNGKDRSLNGLQRLIGQQTVVPVLEGTKVETNQINDLFDKKNVKTTLFQNKEATEENIKALQNPTILHIATHGFFINQIPDSEVKTMQEVENKNLLKNPFLRSGLLLAGCQNPQTGEEDGILSAEEAMNLHLDGTELVVLSACETGLGDIQNGEGVYGLQRAFRQAGAKTLIMSLWKVSDDATQLLMVTFYENLLSGKSKREAFKIAQLKLKEKYNEPYYWGAFVMVGE
ncbi:CHAT domain-containing protein [Bernardetia sp. OM2101]|uniref:CHAT domain-containing protein n=1 Tax=Bernardetia sp. OM2101 TaxID=3344876 RepID=UPI0035CE9EBA